MTDATPAACKPLITRGLWEACACRLFAFASSHPETGQARRQRAQAASAYSARSAASGLERAALRAGP